MSTGSVALELLTESQFACLSQSDSKTELFTLNKRNVLAKITSVYDGDSCKANIFIGDALSQFTIRIMGYDSPEIRTKNSNEKAFAIKSKEAISALILDKVVRVECLDYDKYGRVLANIFALKAGAVDNHEELNVNEFMVTNHLGHPYFGSTKTRFDELLESKYYNLDSKVVLPSTQTYTYKSVAVKKATDGNPTKGLEIAKHHPSANSGTSTTTSILLTDPTNPQQHQPKRLPWWVFSCCFGCIEYRLVEAEA